MKVDEQELESFLIDRPKEIKRSTSKNISKTAQLRKATKSRHAFKIAIAVPVLASLTFIVLLDRYSQKQNVALAEQATVGTIVTPATRASARLIALNPVAGKEASSKEPSLSELKSMSTSALVSKLQSTSSDTIKKNVLSQTGRQVSDAQIQKARSRASSSSVINKLDSARESYSGSSSDAIARIRGKLSN